MEFDDRLLSNPWFYSQGYQDELEYHAFGRGNRRGGDRDGRGDDREGQEGQESQESQEKDRFHEISLYEQSEEPFNDPWVRADRRRSAESPSLFDRPMSHLYPASPSSFSNSSSFSSFSGQPDPLDENWRSIIGHQPLLGQPLLDQPLLGQPLPNKTPNSMNSMNSMEENYSDCFFSQCDPFESLLPPKNEIIEIDVEGSVSPPSLPSLQSDHDHDEPMIPKLTTTTRYKDLKIYKRMEMEKRERLEKLEKRERLDRLDRLEKREKTRRGRPQNARPISQKAQISKDWREKKKRQEAIIQEKIMKLEVENRQLNKQNTKFKDEIRDLRRLVEKMSKINQSV